MTRIVNLKTSIFTVADKIVRMNISTSAPNLLHAKKFAS